MTREPPAVEVRGLTVEGPTRLLDGVELTLRAGERLGMVGPSGAGKTLTLLAILGLLDSGEGGGGPRIRPPSSVRVAGREVVGAPPEEVRRLRRDVLGAVFQWPRASLNPVRTVGAQLAELHSPPTPHRAGEEVRARLDEVGLPDPGRVAGLYPHELSAGMAQRVQVALALARDPEVLLADEVTAGLDSVRQVQILNLLAGLCERRGMALLLVSHDLARVGEFCPRVVVLRQGRTLGSGDPAWARSRIAEGPA